MQISMLLHQRISGSCSVDLHKQKHYLDEPYCSNQTFSKFTCTLPYYAFMASCKPSASVKWCSSVLSRNVPACFGSTISTSRLN